MTIVNSRCLCKQEHILISKCQCLDKGYFCECMQSFLLRPNRTPAVVGILCKDIVVLMYMDICPL